MSELHARLEWDKTGERFYHTGVKNGVLYPQASGAYPKGVAWNGLTQVNGNPDGAEVQDLWADNMKYASFRAAETYGGSISAFMWPDEWYQCDGYRSPTGLEGLHIGQQTRLPFGLCYRTEMGNDTMDENDDAYVLHLVYGASASPSDQEHSTMNESPDAVEFSWDFETTPVTMTTALTKPKPTSYLEIESRKFTTAQMTAIEDVLYGSATADARLPLPDEVATILQRAATP